MRACVRLRGCFIATTITCTHAHATHRSFALPSLVVGLSFRMQAKKKIMDERREARKAVMAAREMEATMRVKLQGVNAREPAPYLSLIHI